MSRARLAGLVVLWAAPFAAVALGAAEAGASVAEQVFFDRLRSLVTAQRWEDAARHIQQVQALKPVPEWLGAREGELRLAQVRIGLGQRDLPAAVNAARLYANGDEARGQQLLTLARDLHAAGDTAAAVALAREIVRRSPEFAAAQRALAEWEPPAKRKTPVEKKEVLTGADEAAALLAQLRKARETDNLPAMLTAARLYLTGDRGRATQLLEIAREYFSSGDRAVAVMLAREVVRRTPGFPAAERQLAEFQAVEKK